MCAAVQSLPTSDQAAETEAASVAPYIPIYALELAIYTIPATSTSLLYVSKVDTTGILSTPAPSRHLTVALLEYYLRYPPHAVHSLRIHVFARSQDQYIFPGSVENSRKRVLGDGQLMKWWRSVIGQAAERVSRHEQEVQASTSGIGKGKSRETGTGDISNARTQLFYLLGGCTTLGDSLAILSRPEDQEDPRAPRWSYGHPYSSASSIPPPVPMPGPSAVPKLNDLIPCFQDDPKARQMSEWASSPIPYAGQDGDYDEVLHEIVRLKDSSIALASLRQKEMLQQREEERAKLHMGDKDVDAFWLVMGNRGECSSGHIAGFFVVVRDSASSPGSAGTDAHAPVSAAPGADADTPTSPANLAAPEGSPGALSHSTYVRLWSLIHNVDYSSAEKASTVYAKWKEELRSAALRQGAGEAEHDEYVSGEIAVDNPADAPMNPLKRAEPPKQVNTLMVKKKKKPNAV